MKRIKIIIIVLMSFAVLYAGSTTLEYLSAKSDGKIIQVEWKSISETTIERYEVERSSSNSTFKVIHTEEARGVSSSYSFTDEDTFYRKNNNDNQIQDDNTYKYRIKIIEKNGSYSYSNTVNVIHSVSSFQRTWGMIKQMFL